MVGPAAPGSGLAGKDRTLFAMTVDDTSLSGTVVDAAMEGFCG